MCGMCAITGRLSSRGGGSGFTTPNKSTAPRTATSSARRTGIGHTLHTHAHTDMHHRGSVSTSVLYLYVCVTCSYALHVWLCVCVCVRLPRCPCLYVCVCGILPCVRRHNDSHTAIDREKRGEYPKQEALEWGRIWSGQQGAIHWQVRDRSVHRRGGGRDRGRGSDWHRAGERHGQE